MEGILAGCSPRVTVMFPVASSVNPARNRSSKELVPGVLLPGARRSAPLRCTRSEEPTDGRVTLTYKGDDFVNSVEVQEWESGMSLNDIAAKQGIRIRRSHRTGHPSEGSKDEKDTPRNILEQIIWDKEVEVAQFKQTKPLETLKKAVEGAPPVRDFVGALRESYRRTGVPALIAEVKKASPSKGVLREDFDPVQIAKTYEKNGAACLSILTDEKYFQGSFRNLEAVRKAGVECPLLCKEFIIDSWQIYNARLKGADAVLLIAGVLPDLDIKYMTMICRELRLAALIEVVGESGLFTPQDISYVQGAGVRAVLVGESLIKQVDPGKAISGLFGKDISK
ncbi:indole-3-glycerol phosphate synthase [Musa troglodytarum]|uniref:indole-3-glycerol-phosphate synthase n=1 Tax=Musa troglodytarum TaxID=320322 RepID=A0A9E7FCH7_9LILI|nr:indole-3-glycerol phosphate synthase [Musa troglodytarum]